MAVSDSPLSASHGSVRQGGFGDAQPAPVRPKAAENASVKTLPAEIVSKPTPTYTEEARKLRIEGEVLLEVVFEASGQIRILRLLRGLGHGLDENAIRAAEQIRFKPAQKDGQATDSTAVLHIIFQLA
jgi:TonB family protein